MPLAFVKVMPRACICWRGYRSPSSAGDLYPAETLSGVQKLRTGIIVARIDLSRHGQRFRLTAGHDEPDAGGTPVKWLETRIIHWGDQDFSSSQILGEGPCRMIVVKVPSKLRWLWRPHRPSCRGLQNEYRVRPCRGVHAIIVCVKNWQHWLPAIDLIQ